MTTRKQSVLGQPLRPLSQPKQPSLLRQEASRDVGVLELTVKDAFELELEPYAKPYVTTNIDGVTSHSSPAQEYRNEDPSAPVWNHTIHHSLASLDNIKQPAILAVYDPGNANKILGSARLDIPEPLPTESCEYWLSLEDGNGDMMQGSLRVSLKFTPAARTKPRISYDDFEIIKTIGRGNFGIVYKVRKKDTKEIYAMKVLSKAAIRKSKTVNNVLSERKVLQHTQTHLYFVMDYKSGGELFQHMQHEGGKFEEPRVRFYVAEVLLALQELHRHNIIYRDLKPENILLDEVGHIALCDFGLSRALENRTQRAKSFCGTTEYLPPEVIKHSDGEGYDRSVDFWALGVLMFEMLAGFTPFYSEERDDKFSRIMTGKLKIPKRGISDDARDLLIRLLNRVPEERIGLKSEQEIRSHPFFAGIDWKALEERKIAPPFKPNVENDDPVYANGAAATNGAGMHPSRRSSCGPGEIKEDEEKSNDWWRDWTFAGEQTRRESVSAQSPLSRSNSINKRTQFGMTALSG